MDDVISIAESRSEAIQMTDLIASQDPDNRIAWKVDFKEN